MASELKHCIRVSREQRSETLLSGTGQFARVVKAAVNGMIGFLVRDSQRIGQAVQVRDVAKAGTRQGQSASEPG